MKKSNGDTDEIRKPVTNIWGVPNFLPETPEGEDERTLEMHQSRLKEEFQKLPQRRKQSVIDSAMTKTFSKRRAEIIVLFKTVEDVCDDYPALKNAFEVK